MGNEFDYSSLYHNTNETGGQPAPQNTAQPDAQQPQNAAAQQGAAPQPEHTAAQPQSGAQADAQPGAQQQTAQPDAGYPNVGSSGMNTANTARTDYSQPDPAAQNQGGYGQQYGPANGYQAQPGAAQNDGYTSSMHGGAAGGYSYASAPAQPPKKQRKGGGKKVALRIVAGVAAVAVAFGSGFGGAILASRLGLTGNNVVMQTVTRGDTDAASQGSAGGTQLSVQDVASLVSPSVVVITTEQMVSSNSLWFGGSYVQSGAGSGVIVSADGTILTCAHVVQGATNINVQLNGSDEQYAATLVGADSVSDVAVLKIEADGLTPAVLGDSDTLAVGEEVIAVGNPLGTLGGTVTNGIVSALNRQINVEGNDMTLIQHSAAVSPGNSGGGLFNANGELIGIVNAKSDSSEAEGLGFAIPINTATEVATDLVENGYVPRPVLGITALEITNQQAMMQYGVDAYGVYVGEISKGSGAEAAGLQLGDRIVAIDSVAVSDNDDLLNYLSDKNVGDVVTLQVERDGTLLSVEVTLGASSQTQ